MVPFFGENMKQRQLDSHQRALDHGRKLALCETEEEIVISGMAGFFPESENVRHFAENLLAKKDLTSDDGRRWKVTENSGVPQRTGILKNIKKFDASFFGISHERAEAMDPQGRILFEKTYEAIIDAGYNPVELKKSNTGLYLATSSLEAVLNIVFSDKLTKNVHSYLGAMHSLMAERISFWLDIKGPSYAIDAGCSTYAVALEHAYSAIRSGACNAAIVAGSNICLIPFVSKNFLALGVCSQEGRSRSFDKLAAGYCRSEAIGAIFLQRRKDARRVYARVVHAKINCEGYKEEGRLCPSLHMQQILMEEFYNECRVDPIDVDFVEAHGTGTKIGDFIELRSMNSVFNKGRLQPLKIGSVKSNMGHGEPASAFCSVVKAVLCFENDKILPNINFTSFPSYVDSDLQSKFQVVTEPTPWEGRFIAINSLGMGGVNGHILLEGNKKLKRDAEPTANGLPQLVLVSGRTTEAVDVIFNDLESRFLDIEYIGLLRQIHKFDIPGHVYRGFLVLDQSDSAEIRDITYFSGVEKPVWFIYPGHGSQWAGMGADLMRIPIFAESIHKCHDALVSENVNILKIVTEKDPSIFDSLVNGHVGITAIAIGLTDLLAAMGIRADGFIGYSLGEMVCAYADGCLTATQAMLLAYYRGKALMTSQVVGSMVLVGLNANEIKKILPVEVDISAHNSSETTTISGPEHIVDMFVQCLREKGVHAVKFHSLNIAAHSRYLENIGPFFLQSAKAIIKDPKLRSNKWISTTFLESDWDSDECRFYSAEHITQNVLGTVYFEEATRKIPEDAIVIEVSPHGILQSILRRSLSQSAVIVPLMSKRHEDNVVHFLSAVGRMYEAGAVPDISQLYPPVEFPVSKGTPMISPLIKWNHSQDWFVGNYGEYVERTRGQRTIIFTPNEKEDEYLKGHIVNEKIVYPAAGYLILVWKTLGKLLGKSYLDMSVVFQNVRFLRRTIIPESGSARFLVIVHKNSRIFEIIENNHLVVTGKVSECKMTGENTTKMMSAEKALHFTRSDVYREFRSRGHDYNGLFRGIACTNFEGTHGVISWYNDFAYFLEAIFQMRALTQYRCASFPVSIQRLRIDPQKHFTILKALNPKYPEFQARFNAQSNSIQSGGVEIKRLKFNKILQNRKSTDKFVLEKTIFVPYIDPKLQDLRDAIRICSQILSENILAGKFEAIEWVDDLTNLNNVLVSQLLSECFREIPSLSLLQANIEILVADVTDLTCPLNQERFKDMTVKYNELLPCNKSYNLVIASEVINRPVFLEKCLKSLTEDGWLLATEKTSSEKLVFEKFNLDVGFSCAIEDKRIFLLRMKVDSVPELNIVTITKVSDVRKIAASNEKTSVILISEKNAQNTTVELLYDLRKEIFTENIRFFFISHENAPPFSLENPFYKSQFDKRLAMNIYKDCSWGSYRQLFLENKNIVLAPHVFVDSPMPGCISALQWFEGPLNPNDFQPNLNDGKLIIHVYCASVNYRDVNSIIDVQPLDELENRVIKESTQGVEFVGRACDGRRFMGIVSARAIASVVECEENRVLPVPNEWTFEDAATVYFSYGKVLQALFMYGHFEAGQSILILSGASDMGLAAMNICLSYECTIFTVVDGAEKREFLKKTFPSLPEDHIACCIDESFETFILEVTTGTGVDIVLKPTSNENVPLNVGLLASGGRILEIGESEELIDSLEMQDTMKYVACYSIGTDFPTEAKYITRINKLMEEFIEKGAVRPLPRTVFGLREIRTAYRYLASGRIVGKVIVKIRDEEANLQSKPEVLNLEGVTRYTCRSDRTYLIYVSDGLDRFSLELGEWLILKGARTLVLICDEEMMSSYQQFRIQFWKSYGAEVTILNVITTEETVKEALEKAGLSKPVSSIFILNEILEPKKFEQETEESLNIALEINLKPTLYFDKLSRKLCPFLEHFVIIMSTRCGAVNTGHLSCATFLSCLQRICEKRKEDDLPATTITFGDNEEYTSFDEDALMKDSKSYLELFDRLLKQPYPIVSCIKLTKKSRNMKGCENVSLIDTVLRILGLPDLRTISLQSTFAEKGMDSLTALELRSIFEKNFNICMMEEQIRSLTFAQLLKMNEELGGKYSGAKMGSDDVWLGYIVVRESPAALSMVRNVFNLNQSEGFVCERAGDFQKKWFFVTWSYCREECSYEFGD